jgi:hypothetical protein
MMKKRRIILTALALACFMGISACKNSGNSDPATVIPTHQDLSLYAGKWVNANPTDLHSLVTFDIEPGQFSENGKNYDSQVYLQDLNGIPGNNVTLYAQMTPITSAVATNLWLLAGVYTDNSDLQIAANGFVTAGVTISFSLSGNSLTISFSDSTADTMMGGTYAKYTHKDLSTYTGFWTSAAASVDVAPQGILANGSPYDVKIKTTDLTVYANLTANTAADNEWSLTDVYTTDNTTAYPGKDLTFTLSDDKNSLTVASDDATIQSAIGGTYTPGITYTVSADGKSGATTTTQLTFTFASDPAAASVTLMTANVLLMDGTGSAVKVFDFSHLKPDGTGTTRTVDITATKEGTISVRICKSNQDASGIGIDSRPQTVTVYTSDQVASAYQETYTGVAGSDFADTTAELTGNALLISGSDPITGISASGGGTAMAGFVKWDYIYEGTAKLGVVISALGYDQLIIGKTVVDAAIADPQFKNSGITDIDTSDMDDTLKWQGSHGTQPSL